MNELTQVGSQYGLLLDLFRGAYSDHIQFPIHVPPYPCTLLDLHWNG